MRKFSGKVLISQEDLQKRVRELGQQISKDYLDKEIVLVGILKGAVFFLSDLTREIDLPIIIDFIAASSYGEGTNTSGIVKILKDLDTDITGKHVLVVEDIIDTGLTLKYLIEILQARKPLSLKICTLLDKKERREVDIVSDYNGFIIPNHFVVGYGIDYRQFYRELPYIGIVSE